MRSLVCALAVVVAHGFPVARADRNRIIEQKEDERSVRSNLRSQSKDAGPANERRGGRVPLMGQINLVGDITRECAPDTNRYGYRIDNTINVDAKDVMEHDYFDGLCEQPSSAVSETTCQQQWYWYPECEFNAQFTVDKSNIVELAGWANNASDSTNFTQIALLADDMGASAFTYSQTMGSTTLAFAYDVINTKNPEVPLNECPHGWGKDNLHLDWNRVTNCLPLSGGDSYVGADFTIQPGLYLRVEPLLRPTLTRTGMGGFMGDLQRQQVIGEIQGRMQYCLNYFMVAARDEELQTLYDELNAASRKDLWISLIMDGLTIGLSIGTEGLGVEFFSGWITKAAESEDMKVYLESQANWKKWAAILGPDSGLIVKKEGYWEAIKWCNDRNSCKDFTGQLGAGLMDAITWDIGMIPGGEALEIQGLTDTLMTYMTDTMSSVSDSLYHLSNYELMTLYVAFEPDHTDLPWNNCSIADQSKRVKTLIDALDLVNNCNSPFPTTGDGGETVSVTSYGLCKGPNGEQNVPCHTDILIIDGYKRGHTYYFCDKDWKQLYPYYFSHALYDFVANNFSKSDPGVTTLSGHRIDTPCNMTTIQCTTK